MEWKDVCLCYVKLWEARTALEVKKLLIMFGNMASFFWQSVTWRNGEEVPEGGNWTWHHINPHVRLASGSLVHILPVSSPQDFSKSPNVLHVIVSMQPISHPLNVCQAEFKIVPPRYISVHSQSQNYPCSICAVSLSSHIIPTITTGKSYIGRCFICFGMFADGFF